MMTDLGPKNNHAPWHAGHQGESLLARSLPQSV